MKHVKAFIAGLAFPATVFPILYSGVYLGGQGRIQTSTDEDTDDD